MESFVFADGQTVTADTLLTLAITPQTSGDGDDIFGQYRKWRHNMAKSSINLKKLWTQQKLQGRISRRVN
ncbi:hypothetical protein [Methylomonas subterranea]|uniref:hypothetical protein n=1 Tax=Methylomonas subterranea TaxID=2952225 RepID=UPI0035318A23